MQVMRAKKIMFMLKIMDSCHILNQQIMKYQKQGNIKMI